MLVPVAIGDDKGMGKTHKKDKGMDEKLNELSASVPTAD